VAMSWQVYYCRWKPAITYCLPITTFTERECKNIQSPFYNALLPKLGINRHMPRTLLHGPLKLAGLSLTNLSAEQLAMHITGLVTQLRKRDRVGLTMHASIDALQLYLGTTAHFFTLNANTMEHRPSRRESPLVYIWEELNSIQCSLICEKFWTPTKTGTNDVAIIDAIQLIKNRRKGTTNHLPKTTIWYVNACRLYLQVTMLSEITTPCGNYLEEWAFHGTRRNPNAFLKYPHQDKPPTHVWRVWRDSIRAAFLKQSTTNRPTLHLPLQRNDYVGGIISWREGICEGMTLEAAIELLPQYIRESLGTIKYPVDNGQRLSKAIKTSVSTSYTDGTVKAKIGAHAYTIRTENDREDVCLSGVVGTPGDANTMTSLRAEHFGVFASIILLDIITMIHGHTDAGEHTHYTDSQAVIDRLNSTYYFNDRQYDSTDYDIWKETENAIKKAANITFTLKHVKGHQKEDLYEVRKQQGPLSRAATYNDWCDSAAETERLAHQKPIQKHFMPAATIYLKTPITLVTASAYRVIYDRKTIPAAQEYVITKLSLTKDTYDMINWEAMGSYMKALAVAQRVKVMKFIYDWQNVGSQKEQQQWADPEEFMCPYKCGQREIPMHYIICAQSCNKMSRMCLEAINQWMIKVRTNNRIRLHIMEELYAPLPMKRIGLNIEYKSPDLFEQARNEQTQLGWKLLFKGLISKTWGAIQEDEYIKIRQREGLAIWYTGSWWTKSLIKHIVFWSLNEWQKRNEQLHKDIEQRECEKTRKENKEHIVQLYQLQETNPVGKLRRYYKVPLIEKLQQNPTRQRQWIETIRALRDKASIQRSKNRL
jgi:ribonuclease HI